MLLSAVFYPMYKDDLSFLLLIAVFIFPVILIILLVISVSMIRVKVYCEDNITEHGKPVRLRVRMLNRSIFPVSACTVTLRYKSEDNKIQKHMAVIPVSAKGSESIIFSLKAEHCGVIDCSVKSVRFDDLIGVFSIWKKVNFHKIIYVHPVVYPYETTIISSMNTDADSDVFSSSKYGDDPAEVFDLREYRAGDSMNRIHWKLSSRGDEYIVKELSEPVSSKVLIIPDISCCQSKKEIDDVMDMFAALSYFLAKKRLKHYAVLSDSEISIEHIDSVEGLTEYFTKQVQCINKKRECSELLELTSNEAFLNSRYSHIIIPATMYNSTVLGELELLGVADRISVIYLGSDSKIYDKVSKTSETVVYITDIENFYEDLVLFSI